MKIKTSSAPLQWSKIKASHRWLKYIIVFKEVDGMLIAHYNKNFSNN